MPIALWSAPRPAFTMLSAIEVKHREHGNENSDHCAGNDSDPKTTDATKRHTGSSTAALDRVLPRVPPQDRIDDPSAHRE